ncbi:hypothetical protein AB9T89_20955 [Flavobacterium oncorhynchi]|uniref:hypothetical protein n=1 Tax=Flavobacterium oncorhynchi TaxID=728056 RepID=UPI00351A56CE
MRKKILKLLCIGSIITSVSIQAQTGIGTVTPASSSILDLTSTDKAFLLTRVANPAVITSPVSGMMIYDLSTNCVKTYQYGAWSAVAEMVASASATPILCTNIPAVTVVHSTANATGIGAPIGLPAGVTAAWSNNSISLIGTATVAGTFSYSIPLKGGCGIVNATGTITVKPVMTVGPASQTPSICINTPLAAVTHSTTNATGIGTPAGLPAGVTAAWSSNTISISGTPTQSGTFSYNIPLVGNGCGIVNATGTITVKPVMTVRPASQTPSMCVNTPLGTIYHSTTNATGIGTPTGLPAGVTAAWSSNTISISGTPTQLGTFSYNIPLVGNGCGIVNATGTIAVKPVMTVSSGSGNANALAWGTSLVITHSTSDVIISRGTPSGLPPGVSASWSGTTLTIAGTPNTSGIYDYSIPLTGTCGTVNATGRIFVSNCGANTSAGSWKAFMCYNLGADTSLSREATVAGINGNYFQWGNLSAAATVYTDPNYVYLSNVRNADGYWQTVVKGSNDPCPAGYRVPNNVEMQGLYTYNAVTRIGAWYADNSNYTSFIRFGNSLSLPAAGLRLYSDGSRLNSRGLSGFYWTSSSAGNSAYFLFFQSSSVNVGNWDKLNAASVRCTAAD